MQAVSKDTIVSALKQAGVAQGDLLFVHSAMRPFGYIDGGANTVAEALVEAVGKDGTVEGECKADDLTARDGDQLSAARFVILPDEGWLSDGAADLKSFYKFRFHSILSLFSRRTSGVICLYLIP